MKTAKKAILFLAVFFASFLLVLVIGAITTPEGQETMPVWVGIALIAIPIPLGVLTMNKVFPTTYEEKIKMQTVKCKLQLVGGLDLAAGLFAPPFVPRNQFHFQRAGKHLRFLQKN